MGFEKTLFLLNSDVEEHIDLSKVYNLIASKATLVQLLDDKIALQKFLQ